MTLALITGAAGLIGPEASQYFAAKGMDIDGIAVDQRSSFFGGAASAE